ncbi:MAG: M36 family metallopeptidase [Methylococcales bacterium]|nr:M36 family metallopeptidase [Methylococcales bacterium]
MKTYHQQSSGLRFLKYICDVLLINVVLILSTGVATAVTWDPKVDNNHYDARIVFNQGFIQNLAPPQQTVISKMARKVPDLAFTFDKVSGVISSLSSHTGYLTEPKTGQEALPVVMDFLTTNAAMLGMSSKDLSSLEVTDRVYSKLTGATHIFMRQVHEGLPVYNSQMQVNLDRGQRILSVNNSVMTDMAASVTVTKPGIDLPAAVSKAAQHLGVSLTNPPKIINAATGVQQITSVDPGGISLEPIQGKLMWLPIHKGMMRLVWNFQIHTLDQQHVYDFTVDAESGKVWTRFDWVASDQYRVYARPAESPNHITPQPPADGRTLVNNPATATASPFGWHDTNGSAGAEFTMTRGNNVHAYTDTDSNNAPDAGSSPNGGTTLNFDFPINLNSAPGSYQNSAVANLFYWNNIIHDVQYQYGFDEAAGNFQTNNYGKGGLGGDAVQAEAQDGSGKNNANFLTPADGTAPRMQMYLWDRTNPERDGDLDNGIIIHEYGHGISTRLVGGPSNVNCLTNSQQPGEGLSDWWSLVYTAKASDRGTNPRGIGTYAIGQPVSGAGIRPQPYSTDPAVNTWTYASINGMRIPHGVGAVWAQAAWEVYWALVDRWGFDPNLYNAMGNAGNQRMMLYVNEGLKNTACNPAFTQVRDGIIDAAKVLHGGEDVCRLWTAFAAFGLGTDAVSGGPGSTSPTNGFSVPVACQVITGPVTAITAPTSGANVAGIITITASANDPGGIVRVEFLIDGNLAGTATSSPYSITLDTRTLSNGSHTLESRARNAAGNIGTSTPVTFSVTNPTVDDKPPVISVSESGTSGTITLNATATDNVGVTKVEFYVDNTLKGTDTTSPYSMTLDSTILTQGSHTLVGKAYDAAGNIGTSTSVLFEIGGTTPTTFNEVERNDSTGSANVIANNVNRIVAYIGTSTDRDYFKINVAAGRTVTVNMTGPTRDYDLYLLRSTGTTLKTSANTGSTESVSFTNTGTATATYYIRVIGFGGAFTRFTPYNLVLSH